MHKANNLIISACETHAKLVLAILELPRDRHFEQLGSEMCAGNATMQALLTTDSFIACAFRMTEGKSTMQALLPTDSFIARALGTTKGKPTGLHMLLAFGLLKLCAFAVGLKSCIRASGELSSFHI